MTISDDNQDARPMETAQDCINRNKPLPAGLTSVGGGLYLRGYAHPLPAGLTSVGGDLYLLGYAHPLPAGLTSVGGGLYLRGYA
ncbi:MAG TPA: hypothetical protein VNL71_20185, partial [Chloroflexota bacterium]|nr:hypothetical protein [Chloroflexota bacterium]